MQKLMRQMKKATPVLGIIGAITGSVIGTILVGFIVQKFVFRPPSFDKVMMLAASEINKGCPMMVDKETRIDNAVALPGNLFQYNYTLINYERAAIDTTALKQAIVAGIINNVRTNPMMKQFRDHQSTIGYNYSDKNGVYIMRLLITPQQYN